MSSLRDLVNQDLSQGLTEDSAKSREHVAKAETAISDWNLEVAMMNYEAALRVDPNNRAVQRICEVWREYSKALYAFGAYSKDEGKTLAPDYESAVFHLKKVISIDPNFRSSINLLRTAAVLSDDWEVLSEIGILTTEETRPTEHSLRTSNKKHNWEPMPRMQFDILFGDGPDWNGSWVRETHEIENSRRAKVFQSLYDAHWPHRGRTEEQSDEKITIRTLISQSSNWQHWLEIWWINKEIARLDIERPYDNHTSYFLGVISHRQKRCYNLGIEHIESTRIERLKSKPTRLREVGKDFHTGASPLWYEFVYPVLVHLWEVPFSQECVVNYSGSLDYNPQGPFQLFDHISTKRYSGEIQFQGNDGVALVTSKGHIVMWTGKKYGYEYRSSA